MMNSNRSLAFHNVVEIVQPDCVVRRFPILADVDQAARALGVDVLNQGLSGACHCAPAVADCFAKRTDGAIATLELGRNMRGSVTAADFRTRATDLIQQLTTTGKPVVSITILPNSELQALL